jgi:hypothetical protein
MQSAVVTAKALNFLHLFEVLASYCCTAVLNNCSVFTTDPRVNRFFAALQQNIKMAASQHSPLAGQDSSHPTPCLFS